MNHSLRPKILMIYTGGTIGMIENPETRALEPFDFNHLLDNVPKIKMLDFDIDSFEFERPLDSSSMDPEDWGAIAKVIEERYDDYDGFVVLHGTDTMAYTASALSFMLEGLDKPVIITGSQLPIGEVRTDGEENLIASLQVAAARNRDGSPKVREVAILFQNYLLRGNRATKHSADNFDAFKSFNYPPLGNIGMAIAYNRDALRKEFSEKPLTVHYDMDSSVIFMDLFPGISENMVNHILHAPGLKGVVLKTFGAGNGPNTKWFLDAIRDAVSRGIVIVNITQCPNGMVLPDRYQTGLEMTKAGVIAGHDMTPEAAITKLMYLLGLGMSIDQVRRGMQVPLRGELTVE